MFYNVYFTNHGPYIYDIHEKFPIFAPPPPFSVCPNGSELGKTPPSLDVETYATNPPPIPPLSFDILAV